MSISISSIIDGKSTSHVKPYIWKSIGEKTYRIWHKFLCNIKFYDTNAVKWACDMASATLKCCKRRLKAANSSHSYQYIVLSTIIPSILQEYLWHYMTCAVLVPHQNQTKFAGISVCPVQPFVLLVLSYLSWLASAVLFHLLRRTTMDSSSYLTIQWSWWPSRHRNQVYYNYSWNKLTSARRIHLLTIYCNKLCGLTIATKQFFF